MPLLCVGVVDVAWRGAGLHSARKGLVVVVGGLICLVGIFSFTRLSEG